VDNVESGQASQACGRVKERVVSKTHLLLAILLGILLVATGCTMDISTVIHPDGSGTVSMSMSETTENSDFIRQIPNMADYLLAWQDSLRKQGIMIDDSRQGDREYIFMQRRFHSLKELSSPADLPGGAKAWVYATAEPRTFETTYRFSAIVDTTGLYESAPGIDSRALSEAHKELNKMQMTYSVTLPGEILFSNADRQRGNKLTWDMRMNAHNEIKAESKVEHTAKVKLFERARTGLILVLAASLGVLICAVVIFLVRHRRQQA